MIQKAFKRRIFISSVLLAFAAAGLIVKIFSLHFSGRIILPSRNPHEGRRGLIKDRNGYVLAVSIEQDSLYVNPSEVPDPERAAEALAPLLGLSRESLREKLSNKKKRFLWVARRMDDDTAERVRGLGLKGLYLKKEFKRVYPHDELAANVIGFVGIDNAGLEGIEYSLDPELSGTYDEEPQKATGPVYRSRNVVLTIDRFVQYVAEKEIRAALDQHSAKQGAVLVLEVKTGRILALAKAPGFNPNFYSGYSIAERRSFSVIDSFEPGSTMKIFALAALLENNPAAVNLRYTCEGSIQLAETEINCTKIHGSVDMPDIIRYSCNVGVIRSVRGLKKDHLYGTLKKFGFGERVLQYIPGESEGLLRPLDKWSGLSKYSLSIGHEMSVTSPQVAAAFGSVGNGGVYIYPSIIQSLENAEGQTVKKFPPRVKGRVLTRAHADYILRMMRGVVKNGTGVRAAMAGYEVAGKTGTANKFSIKGGGYSDRVVASFAGLAPFEDPQICIYVVVDDPANKASGGEIATPVFRSVAERILPYLGYKKEIRGIDSIQKREPAGEYDGRFVPDFRGLRLSEAVRLLVAIQRRYGVQYYFSGEGTVTDQKPRPGEKLISGQKIILYLGEK